MTYSEQDEVAEIVNRIGQDHGFEFERTEYFTTNKGAHWFEVSIRQLPGYPLMGHCVGIKVNGQSLRSMATEAATALAEWADNQMRKRA